MEEKIDATTTEMQDEMLCIDLVEECSANADMLCHSLGCG